VGQPVKGVKVEIAPDGEILIQGPNVMQGYYNKRKATEEALAAGGWLRTGDIGEITEEGCLKITGRKKDILVLANGKNVSPQPIESRLQTSEYISQIVLLGDRQSTVTALVVPAFFRVIDWAKRHRITFSDNGALSKHPEVIELIRDEIKSLSSNLASFETVHRFCLMAHEFTEEKGELTPSLKLKRHVILERYKDLIGSMHGK
jgi:long-chain acyl-CoA synthetase